MTGKINSASRWYINDEAVMGEDNTVLLLANVTRAMHDTIVKCEVKNEVGKSEESETLDISCEFIFDCAPS